MHEFPEPGWGTCHARSSQGAADRRYFMFNPATESDQRQWYWPAMTSTRILAAVVLLLGGVALGILPGCILLHGDSVRPVHTATPESIAAAKTKLQQNISTRMREEGRDPGPPSKDLVWIQLSLELGLPMPSQQKYRTPFAVKVEGPRTFGAERCYVINVSGDFENDSDVEAYIDYARAVRRQSGIDLKFLVVMAVPPGVIVSRFVK